MKKKKENNLVIGENNPVIAENNIAIDENNVVIDENNVIIDENNIVIDENNVVIDENNIAIGENKPVIGENKPAKKAEKVKTPANKPIEPPAPKETNRKGITVMFSVGEGSEYGHLALIIQNRIDAGLSRSESHFVRQCIDYAINAQHFTDREIIPKFSTHDENMPWEYKILKDALFAGKKHGLRTCK